ncbi:dynamin family protein [Rubrivivax gelatinosus]|uniref:Dynamin family protein n=1 Tax=Rubrivivax gelatinosus TaxID=28068 RepID=A0ABS1E136_RUBGE|nr:dynamin family protein [Rubrivivax gelatinosus]MBK1715811.1 dynamin family protein [Rubrivivax gelatinosus]
MQSSLVTTLETLSAWRHEVDRRVGVFVRFLADHDLADPTQAELLAGLRARLTSERILLAFVAEFSRGKSELINAIFFAAAGRRVMPATPGRTTMCPVELFHDPALPPRLALLPIETRLAGLSLAELRGRDDAWQQLPLDPADADGLERTLAAVTRTRRVAVDEARALGFWHEDRPEDNPPVGADGRVEVPAWRHALINFPHELLSRGLVVLDTPGLNAIGAEPELTLSLLPSAHACVFLLAADTGVTRSDLAIWREHLGADGLERFVVLNKIDTLADPLVPAATVAAQIERQRELSAAALGLPRSRVFPLSARDALAARVAGDAGALARSRLPELEAALSAELIPRQHEVLAHAAAGSAQQMRSAASRRLADRRRQLAEQLLELRGLRGKSTAKVRLMLERIDAESDEFDGCLKRLSALRAVQSRQLSELGARLGSDALRTEVAAMLSAIGGLPFSGASRESFATLFKRLRAALGDAAARTDEMRRMLDSSFVQLNTEHGFAFALQPPPPLTRYDDELDTLEQNYSRYLGLAQGWRMALPGFAEQFRRMLVAKLRVVFESASHDVEVWSKSQSAQVDEQLRERRRAFRRRREALERIQAASGELEARIAEVELQDAHLVALHGALDRVVDELVTAARDTTAADSAHAPLVLDAA